jgi:hypothetical protein
MGMRRNGKKVSTSTRIKMGVKRRQRKNFKRTYDKRCEQKRQEIIDILEEELEGAPDCPHTTAWYDEVDAIDYWEIQEAQEERKANKILKTDDRYDKRRHYKPLVKRRN